MQTDTIIMYGTTWCGDCHRSKRVLEERGAAYRWVNIETEPGAAETMMELIGRDGSHSSGRR